MATKNLSAFYSAERLKVKEKSKATSPSITQFRYGLQMHMHFSSSWDLC